MITAKCYGGPLDGEWITAESGMFEVPIKPPVSAMLDLDPNDLIPIRTTTYVAKWIRPIGWRIAFPVFVVWPGVQLAKTVLSRMHRAYGAHDSWPIEMGERLR